MKGVEDALGRLEGVRAIRIDLQKNLVTITPAPDRVVDLARIPTAIERAGFTPEGLRIVARGSAERAGDGVRFRIAGWPVTYPAQGEVAGLDGSLAVEADVRLTVGGLELRLTKVGEPERG
ncbi:MAG: heavy-metal-associated domain-containing protein [Planctomycetes bacterium]|nr:heavy-metal-associated domain-containing protein [Planctomycetota bacterium]